MGRKNRGSGREKVLNPIIARYFIFSLKCTKKRLTAGLRPYPLGTLSAPPSPLAAMGAMEGNDSLAADMGALR